MYHIIQRGETLTDIARNYRIPLSQLLSFNPAITNPSIIYIGQRILIPNLTDHTQIPYQIIVSKGNRTLTLLRNGIVQKTYPVAIGKMLTGTPEGQFIIVNREPNPGGPFGVMWLSLSKAGYGIHGTNNPSSIGKAVSHGCIRMHNKDVLELASIVPNGTRVDILS
ncbi:L,D-transpeptidase family protein [Cytobacillus purgationiresistens]|uniref:Lipoprotein-anchoring transpeptidase ErfK/SrfK n=1 Tax=Cytobacillus purgationiresistens TaxID=863449 RepID=A0ABU0AHC8_9BACI|nr:L,D-transpeptidase family protein [Cytobacillus purgationiresistens]MDQ0270670.1 lipoprotein-anchoring transpeptidase ErfK/SrfK [Cytobacillus purgationiresistens]